MRIHLLSDLHVEIQNYTPARVNADVVVLAGDIHSKARSAQWALEAFNWFDGPIIFVAGNHDFYGAELHSAQRKFDQAASDNNGRLYCLEQQSLILDGVRFLGATCWTDFRFGGNPHLSKFDASRSMNDYRNIRMGSEYRRLLPGDTELIACSTRRWLEEELSRPFEGKTVLVTHHPITAQSIDPDRAPKLLDAAYYNAWEHLFFEPFQPLDLVLHGHTHFAVDYELNQTRVVSNPRGYPGEQLDGFKSELVLEA